MSQPDVQIGCVSNLFSRQMTFKSAGDREEGHAHTFDHLTLLAKGKLQVQIGSNEPTEFTAPHMIYIKANTQHQLTALEDDTVAYCIHALRDLETGDILDPSMIPTGVELDRIKTNILVK